MSNGTWRDSLIFSSSYSGLKVQVTSATQVTVTASELMMKSTTGAYLATSVSVTGTITASGANGLDTGSEASNTWYYVWVIYNDSTIALLLSTSSTAPTMPSGYTYKVRVGAIRNDGSSNLYRTIQYGNDAQYVNGTNPASIIAIDSGITADTSSPQAVLGIINFVPSTASRIRGCIFASNSRSGCAPNSSYGAYSSTTNPPPVSIYANGAGISQNSCFDFILESSSIYWFSNGSNNFISVLGWQDNL
mgnify:CR=1 FL=1